MQGLQGMSIGQFFGDYFAVFGDVRTISTQDFVDKMKALHGAEDALIDSFKQRVYSSALISFHANDVIYFSTADLVVEWLHCEQKFYADHV